MPLPSGKQIPFTKQERRFFEAMDRILEGKPRQPELQPAALAKARHKLKLTKTTLAIEAGFARTYLYKNAKTMGRVLERFAEVTESRRPATTARDLISSLRADNARLRNERNLAIDVARRWIQEGEWLRTQIEMKDQLVERLKAGQVGARTNVVDLGRKRPNA